MSNLEFLKKEAKNLLKDWKTQTKTVESDGSIFYNYSPKFYDVADLFLYYEFSDKDEHDIKLSRAQHLIAKIAGFKKWNELIHASPKRLELAELVVRNIKNSSDIEEWNNVILFSGFKEMDETSQLEYARQYFEFLNNLTDEDPYNGGVPFDWDMDQGYVDEFE